MLIEQAIFTSAETDRAAGYQLVAQSPGVSEADARELAAWGPSHDSLLEGGADAESINFHPLPSGCYCVSKTTPGGSEYSGRRGPQIYTQCLVVPADVLERFGNNAFSLLTAAFAQGQLKVHDRIPDELEAFRLGGRAAPIDQSALQHLLVEPGLSWLNALVQALVAEHAVALISQQQRPRMIAGLISCFPVECRPQFSFSTGLKYSPRRPFKLVCLGGDSHEQRRVARQGAMTLLDLTGKPPVEYTAVTGWGGLISTALAAGKSRFLAAEMGRPRAGLRLADLDRLGDGLLERLARETEALASQHPATTAAASSAPAEPLGATAPLSVAGLIRADGAHARSGSPETADAALALRLPDPPTPADVMGWYAPQTLDKLELLDDTVFEAIAGKREALTRVKQVWREVVAHLDPELVDESRAQYLRHALNVWRQCVDGDEIRQPQRAIATIEVISALLEDPPAAAK